MCVCGSVCVHSFSKLFHLIFFSVCIVVVVNCFSHFLAVDVCVCVCLTFHHRQIKCLRFSFFTIKTFWLNSISTSITLILKLNTFANVQLTTSIHHNWFTYLTFDIRFVCIGRTVLSHSNYCFQKSFHVYLQSFLLVAVVVVCSFFIIILILFELPTKIVKQTTHTLSLAHSLHNSIHRLCKRR